MAGLPSWRQQAGDKSYAGARKWGTGINPIHGEYQGYEGRNLALPADIAESTGLETEVPEDYGFMTEDHIPYTDVDFSFMNEHPSLGQPTGRGTSRGFPAWGNGAYPIPQGTAMRGRKRGMNYRETHPQEIPTGEAGEGWTNKLTTYVLDSRTSDPEQLYVQTSERQRDGIMDNTRATTRGTDAARSEIATRLPGMRLKTYTNQQRLDDMTPYGQDQQYIRPFFSREAGTGPVQDMLVNDMYVSEPIARTIPADVDETLIDESDLTADQPYGEEWGY